MTYLLTLSPRQLSFYAEARAFYLRAAAGSFLPLPEALSARAAAADADQLQTALERAAVTITPERRRFARAIELPDPKQLLTTWLTRDQLADFADATEFLARWCFGQVDHLPLWLAIAGERSLLDERLGAVKRLLFPELRGLGHSYGIAWNEKPEQQAGQIGYELWKAALHQLMKIRRAEVLAEGGEWFGTCHDDPLILIYSQEPRMQIQTR